MHARNGYRKSTGRVYGENVFFIKTATKTKTIRNENDFSTTLRSRRFAAFPWFQKTHRAIVSRGPSTKKFQHKTTNIILLFEGRDGDTSETRHETKNRVPGSVGGVRTS